LHTKEAATSTKKKSLLGVSKSTKKASVAKSEAGTKGAKIESMRLNGGIVQSFKK